MDVIFKEGMLYLQGVKFGKKTWKKTWMVLFQPSNMGIGRLEMYDLSASAGDIVSHQVMTAQQKRAERKVVRLCDCTSVAPAPEEACPRGCTALYLSTTLRTYTLASEACQEWLSALCQVAFKDPRETDKRTRGRGDGLSMEDNALYSPWKEDVTLAPGQYQVMVHPTESSRRCQLSGEYVFATDESTAMLLKPNTGHVLYHWPYKYLRRFGPVKGGFSFEAGHRCDSGEGLFTFLSPNAVQIYQAITKHCLVKDKAAGGSPSNIHKRLFYENVPDTRSTTVLPPNKTHNSRPDPPAGAKPRAAEPLTDHYSTIEEIGPHPHSALDRRKSPVPTRLQRTPHFTAPSEEWEGDNGDDEERCDSMNSINSLILDSIDEASEYCNYGGAQAGVQQDPAQSERDIYSFATFPEPCSQLPTSSSSSSSSLSSQQPRAQALSSSGPGPAKPQRLALVKSQAQQPSRHQQQQQQQQQHRWDQYAALNAVQQTQPPLGEEDHTKEEDEEAVTPAEISVISVSFKQKLSQIISKDLAKLQPPLTSGGDDDPPMWPPPPY